MNVNAILNDVRSHPSVKTKMAISDIDVALRDKYTSVEKFISVIQSQTFCTEIFRWYISNVSFIVKNLWDALWLSQYASYIRYH